MIDDDDDSYPLGEYPPLEALGDLILGWVAKAFLNVLDAYVDWKEGGE